MPAPQQIQLLPVVARLDANDAFRIALAELPQHRGENVLARRRARTDAQPPVAPLRKIIEAGPRSFHFAQDFFGVTKKLFSRLREQHATTHAIQQTTPHVVLERLDRVAHRRLR
jgi:hypothetical protein